ncbi:MAG: cysteine desulfurase [Lachnospiraceae bacterium]|nr:cysteine desulfurase [Lachnospiraceae bacterium]
MEAYLDNAATTRAAESVVKVMDEVLEKDFGNPSSKHIKGVDAERYIRDAAEKIAATLKCDAKEIVFTSGGTEANNMALIGAALANRREGMTIITTAFEHASVYNPILFLEEMGFTVKFAPVDEMGHVKLDELLELVDDDTILVSVMKVNNEIGSVVDVKQISDAVKKKKPDVIVHVDAIQAYGKMSVIPKREGIDLMSVSAHKFHGPKGCGFLYVRKGVKIKPLIYGGGQQGGMRSGTENVPAIAGLGVAAQYMCSHIAENSLHMYRLKQRFIEGVEEIEGTTVNAVLPKEQRNCGCEENEKSGGSLGAKPACDTGAEGTQSADDIPAWIGSTAPHIVSVSFAGIDRSEVLLHALEEKGVYVSSGSACSSNHPGISGTLKAIGVDKSLLNSTLRFSFCDETTREEIDYALECLGELLPVLRKFKRR